MEYESFIAIKSLWDFHKSGSITTTILDQRQLRRGNYVPSRGPTEHNIGSVSSDHTAAPQMEEQ